MGEQYPPGDEFRIPDWLRGVGDELLSDDGAPTRHPGGAGIADETPDWLRELVSQVDRVTPGVAAAGEGAGSRSSRGAEHDARVGEIWSQPPEPSLPDWVQRIARGDEIGASTEPEAGAAASERAETAEETAGWLSQLTAMRSEAAAAIDHSASDWITPVAPVADPGVPQSRDERADLPDWLRDISPVAASSRQPEDAELPGAGLPEWARALAASAHSPETQEPHIAPEQWTAPRSHAENRPRGGQSIQPSDIASDVPSPAQHPGPVPISGVSGVNIGDWERPEPMAQQEPESQERAGPDQSPTLSAWLTDGAAANELPVSMEPEPSAGPSGSDAVLPDWLRELQEPRTPPTPGSVLAAGAEVSHEEAEVADSDDAALPEWLRRLRAGITDASSRSDADDLAADLAALSIVDEVVREPDPSRPSENGLLTTCRRVADAAGEPAGIVPDEGILAAESGSEAQTACGPHAKPAEGEEPGAPPGRVEVIIPPLEDLPRDASARLTLARAAARSGSWSQALGVYQSLVSSSDLLSSVIGDLEDGIRKHPDDHTGYQLMGDACVKDGRLPEALQAYRTALTKLRH